MTPVAAEAVEEPVAVAVPYRPPRPGHPPFLLLVFLLLSLIRHQRFVRQHRTGLHQEHLQSVLVRVVLLTIYLGWRLQWRSRRRLRQRSRRGLCRRQLSLVLLLLARLIASSSVLFLFPSPFQFLFHFYLPFQFLLSYLGRRLRRLRLRR